MRKFIRNDYTFVIRLEKLERKYAQHSKKYSILSKECERYYKMYVKIGGWIDRIKEDMRLKALQNINDENSTWKQEYECIFTK